MDAHHGGVPVAHVNAGGVGAGLLGVVGGCAGESCCGVRVAQLVHGVPDDHVGGCGWAGTVVVGGGQVAYDGGAHKEGEKAVYQAQCVQEIIVFLSKSEVRE